MEPVSSSLLITVVVVVVVFVAVLAVVLAAVLAVVVIPSPQFTVPLPPLPYSGRLRASAWRVNDPGFPQATTTWPSITCKMAAVHPNPSSRHPKSRLRSLSDPFVDPATKAQRPPPPPPKTKAPRMPAPVPKSAPAHRDITEAVRDTVTVRGSTDYNPRTRVGRSQTAMYVYSYLEPFYKSSTLR